MLAGKPSQSSSTNALYTASFTVKIIDDLNDMKHMGSDYYRLVVAVLWLYIIWLSCYDNPLEEAFVVTD